MKAIEWSYTSYLAVAVPLTIYVAKNLYQNGRVFLVECFKGNEELADSVNKLLLVGFYLVNLGFVSLYLKTDVDVVGLRGVLELLSKKIGVIMLVLGCMHFFNLYLFTKIGRKPSAGPPRGQSNDEYVGRYWASKIAKP